MTNQRRPAARRKDAPAKPAKPAAPPKIWEATINDADEPYKVLAGDVIEAVKKVVGEVDEDVETLTITLDKSNVIL